MLYFAYGSNMSLPRLKARVSSAVSIGHAMVLGHQLAFHKIGRDGSGKCDLVPTGIESDLVHGVLFQFDRKQKALLDQAEDLGRGYAEIQLDVLTNGERVTAHSYQAIPKEPSLLPFDWYLEHLLFGAEAAELPLVYRCWLQQVEFIKDIDQRRANRERAVYQLD
ncbi:gamma-glutamylcyclotransferase family protein [Corallincola platygyrae]|uniref:Gamma-glutamylcyclotransferase family protein n=1 Tax=Corallincola platygyrae TaxID=1193278 RepID=A0ABW4XN97_9GAMM